MVIRLCVAQVWSETILVVLNQKSWALVRLWNHKLHSAQFNYHNISFLTNKCVFLTGKQPFMFPWLGFPYYLWDHDVPGCNIIAVWITWGFVQILPNSLCFIYSSFQISSQNSPYSIKAFIGSHIWNRILRNKADPWSLCWVIEWY